MRPNDLIATVEHQGQVIAMIRELALTASGMNVAIYSGDLLAILNRAPNVETALNGYRIALNRIANEFGHCEVCKIPVERFTGSCDCPGRRWEQDDPKIVAAAALKEFG